MRAVNSGYLFEKRPRTATIGLTIAGLDALALLYQGLADLLKIPVINIGLEKITQVGDRSSLLKLSIFTVLWAIANIIAIYLSLEPRPVARFTTIIMSGLNVILVFAADKQGVTTPYVMMLVAIYLAPIFFLLTPSSNVFYENR